MRSVVISTIIFAFTASLAIAEPMEYTITSAATKAGCTSFGRGGDPVLVSSDDSSYPGQWVYEVRCEYPHDTYVIIVCDGQFDCRAMR